MCECVKAHIHHTPLLTPTCQLFTHIYSLLTHNVSCVAIGLLKRMNDRLTELRRSGGATASVASDDVAIDIKGGGGAFAQPAFMTEFFTDVEGVKVSLRESLCCVPTCS